MNDGKSAIFQIWQKQAGRKIDVDLECAGNTLIVEVAQDAVNEFNITLGSTVNTVAKASMLPDYVIQHFPLYRRYNYAQYYNEQFLLKGLLSMLYGIQKDCSRREASFCLLHRLL